MTCVICGADPMGVAWTDLSGEAGCSKCGVPYQMKWGTEEQKKEGKYPYINIRDDLIPHLKEYWETTGKKARTGRYLAPYHDYPGLAEERKQFSAWLDQHHPEWRDES